ncbi:flavin-containing monooxygenase [Subtercola lobariae]|uniref:Cyclohexanone monooxygenase n=1 Tax=Subtercola lobariae TaxID=1588641 RepID=A0A917BI10_9MICO|nr:NAD(P)/FAD-dependent oxidoreductase [Subtercola lobariae]GGF42062.1 cyclohexanone monooxygenase [Subtercola lobariae]
MSEGNLRAQFTHHVKKSVVSADELRRHARAAQTNQLLLVAVHVTGDVSLLDRYAGRIAPAVSLTGRSTSPAGEAEAPEVREELLARIESVLTSEDQAHYLGVEDSELFQRLSALAAGFEVPATHAGMNREQAGFVPDQRAIIPTKTPSKTLNLAIIGAGMTGIDAAIKAADRGFEYEIFDAEAGIGGLWWSQSYPGVAVDTPAMYYSLSWEVTSNWSRFFPVGEEYQHYLQGIAEKYGLLERTHFNSEITRMEWFDEEQVWELTVLSTVDNTSRVVRAAAVVTATGHLNRAKYPNVSGIETFAGESVHTGTWRDVELDGKRVACVGVGAAGIQIVSSVAARTSHLSVFQRQAHWVSPNTVGEGIVSESEHWLREHLPYYLQWARFTIFAQVNAFSHLMNEVDEEWMSAHPDSVSISAMNDLAMKASLNYINDTFGEGSELAIKLTPDFPYGGKRPVRDPKDYVAGGYYYSLAQPNVDLITTPIARVVPEGIVTADGALVELDVIIWATGMTLEWLAPVEIIGRDGIRLSDVWANNNPRSYLGGTVPAFPNLFINDGPNTGVANGGGGHNFMAETVNHYIFEALQLLVENDAASIEVTQEAHDQHNEEIERLMADLLWAHDTTADTYYRNESGRIILPSPFLPEVLWQLSQTPDESKFRLTTSVRLETSITTK